MAEISLDSTFDSVKNVPCMEKLRKLSKCTRKQSLTRETVIKVEKAIEELKAGRGETQSYVSCTEFYDSTDAESKNGLMHSSHREKRERYRLQGYEPYERRSGEEKSNSYRKDKSRSENVVSTSVSWTKYDKRIERCTRYSPLYLKDDASESSSKSDMQISSRMRQLTKSSNGKSNRNSRLEGQEKWFRRVKPNRYWSSYCDRRTSRSPSRPRRTEPQRYYSRRADRSKSRSRSRLRKKSTDRYRRRSSRESCGNRSKSRSRSRIRKSSRGRYFHETADKRRSKSRSPTRRKTGPTEQRRRNYSYERDITHDANRCRTPSWEGRNDDGLSDVVNKLKTKIKSTLANASNHNKSTERSAEESTCRSNSSEWEDTWDIDVAEAEDRAQSTSFVTANDKLLDTNKIQSTFAKSLKVDQLTDARSKLCSLIESRLKDRTKIESEPLPVPPDRNVESNFWQTNDLIDEDHRMLPSLEFDISSEQNQKNTETTIDSREVRATTDDSIDDDIIQKIVSKSANECSPTVELAPSLPFDIDSIKEALATAKSNIDKNVSAIDYRRYVGSALTMNTTAHLVHPNLSRLQEIQPLQIQPIQPQQDFSRPRPYCPVSVPKWMIPNAPMIQVAPVQPTPKQIVTAPNSTAAPRPNLLTALPVTLPIPSPKFLPRISFDTPTYPNHTNLFNRNPFSSNVDRQKISHRRATVFSERDHTAKHTKTYGEYKTSQVSKNLDWNFKIPKKTAKSHLKGFLSDYKIPKKTPTKTITATATKVVDRSASVTMDEEPNSKGSEESDYDDSESYSPPTTQPDVCKNNQLDKHSISENGNAADPVDNNPSKGETTITTLKKLMASKQFITFVDLMGKMAQNDTLTKVKEALTNCTNECVPNEGGEGTSTSSGTNDSTATDESTKNIPKRNQNTKTTRTRCRSASPTSTTKNIPTDKPPTKPFKKSLPRTGSAVQKPVFKNVKLEWHSLKKVLSCQICDKPCLISLVSHYVNDHPKSEVLVSRLAPDVAESLRSGISVNKCKLPAHPGNPSTQFQQFCFFCNVEKTFSKAEWFIHMARHTGYYRYQCNDCSRLFADKPGKPAKCAIVNDFKVVSQPQFQKNTKHIKAYVCDLCNYVRFNKNEIEMHLSNEHDHPHAKEFSEFKFLSFPITRRKRKQQSLIGFVANSGGDSESDYESDSESENESKPLDDENDVESESKSSNVPVDEEGWKTLESGDDSN